jgi:hypothetical protein
MATAGNREQRVYARAMSLEEKRAIKAAEDGWVKTRLAETAELCGGAIPYELAWATFAGDLTSIEWLEANGPHQVNVAFRQICIDELGREAVRGAVKKIVFKAVKSAADKHVTLADGVLEVAGKYSDGIAGTVREGEIKAYLLSQL